MTTQTKINGYVLSIDAWNKYITVAEGEPGGTNQNTLTIELAYASKTFQPNDLVSWTAEKLPSGKVVAHQLNRR